jgi:hypothetical protein
MILAHVLVTTLLVVASGPGCRPREKPKRRYASLDGGEYAPRKECNKPSFDCYESCAKREASDACSGCCFDQRLLCDTLQPYSFESCESAP